MPYLGNPVKLLENVEQFIVTPKSKDAISDLTRLGKQMEHNAVRANDDVELNGAAWFKMPTTSNSITDAEAALAYGMCTHKLGGAQGLLWSGGSPVPPGSSLHMKVRL